MSAAKKDIAADVTARIVAQLESGVAPWVKPWKIGSTGGSGIPSGLDFPTNALTGKRYRGANILLLWVTTVDRGYSDARWVTFKQAKTLGGCVRKGEKGTAVVFWRFLEREETNPTTGKLETRKVPMLRVYTVFNVQQCDGLSVEAPVVSAPDAGAPSAVDALVERHNIALRHGGGSACYTPTLDVISMPKPEQFTDRANYDATLLHECVHWTGHASRLDRQLGKRFGDEAYAVEELVAELGAAFACAQFGIAGQLQHAEYLGHWIKVLKSDKNAIFTAASQAEKALDFFTATAAEDESVDEEEAAA